MSIDPVLNFFAFGTPPFVRLVEEFRRRIFEEVAASDLPGLIFTYAWALNEPAERVYIDKLTAIFEQRGARVCFAELAAPQQERLLRKVSPLRLAHKAPKRDLAHSRANLIALDQQYQLNTNGDFPYPDRHLKIDNTQITPAATAARIAEHFALATVAS
jgi:hypothetical protein